MTAFALIHSPLTGPSVWIPVSEALEQRGQHAVVPELVDSGDGRPSWEQHAASAAAAIDRALAGSACLLVGHSGAGPLLPAIQAHLKTAVSGHLYVDAGLPGDGISRLDQMKSESPDWAEKLEHHLRGGGLFPEWTDRDLQALIPDPGRRRRTLAELRPRALDFFTEPIPGQGDLLPVPSGYLRFSTAYDIPAGQAEALGWPVVRLEAGHFHMLVRPGEVAVLLVEMLALLSA